MFPENLIQATLQRTVTVYVPSKELVEVEINSTNILEPTMVRELVYRTGVNSIGIVVFCLAFGSIISSLGEQCAVMKHFFSALFQVMLKMIEYSMWLSGIGVASIITGKLLSINNLNEVISQLALFFCSVLLGISFHQLIMLPTIYFLIVRKNPYTFLLNLIDPWVAAFAVCSSAAILPTTLHWYVTE